MKTCAICEEREAKYRCPKCFIRYCSLVCFKSEKHNHDDNIPPEKNELTKDKVETNKWEVLANDSVIRSMLKYKSLQFHLSVIQKIISDVSVTGESEEEARKEIANMKLTELRKGGSEENELVEDFVQAILQHLQANQ